MRPVSVFLREGQFAYPLGISVASCFCITHLTPICMLGFLRRIRRSLIEKGHLRKYLVYAIGEILLVVIGILLALQVNNWNEDRKSSKEIQEVLSALKSNTNSNIQQLQQVNRGDLEVINSIKLIMNNLTHSKVYNDTLAHHFMHSGYYHEPAWKMGAYETLIAKGLDSVETDSLRERIVDVYEVGYQKLSENMLITRDLSTSLMFPAISQRLRVTDFSVDTFEEKAEPVHYEQLVGDETYLNILSLWRLHLEYVHVIRSKLIKELQALNTLISDKLDEY